MSEDFGSDFITIVDDDGTEFELELLDTMDYKGQTFVAFLPADMDENDPDYGLVILRSVIDENGDELFESIDDEDELQDVYEHFAVLLFDDEDLYLLFVLFFLLFEFSQTFVCCVRHQSVFDCRNKIVQGFICFCFVCYQSRQCWIRCYLIGLQLI